MASAHVFWHLYYPHGERSEEDGRGPAELCQALTGTQDEAHYEFMSWASHKASNNGEDELAKRFLKWPDFEGTDPTAVYEEALEYCTECAKVDGEWFGVEWVNLPSGLEWANGFEGGW